MCAIPSKTPMELPTAQRRFCWCWRTNLSTINQKYSSDALQNSYKRRNQPRKFSLGLPPLTSHQRGQHICDILAHTSMSSQSGFPASTYPCGAPRCRKCVHVSSKDHDTIREHFTYKSRNVVYCILYIGETPGKVLCWAMLVCAAPKGMVFSHFGRRVSILADFGHFGHKYGMVFVLKRLRKVFYTKK